MKKLFLLPLLLAGLMLGGCQTFFPSVDLNTAVTLNTVYGIENAYGIAINAANAYKKLPLCKTGTKPSATNICAKRSVIVNLQGAVRRATTAVNAMVAFQKTYPTLNITNAISAAREALLDVQSVLSSGAQ